jgi:hypothetical protein
MGAGGGCRPRGCAQDSDADRACVWWWWSWGIRAAAPAMGRRRLTRTQSFPVHGMGGDGGGGSDWLLRPAPPFEHGRPGARHSDQPQWERALRQTGHGDATHHRDRRDHRATRTSGARVDSDSARPASVELESPDLRVRRSIIRRRRRRRRVRRARPAFGPTGVSNRACPGLEPELLRVRRRGSAAALRPSGRPRPPGAPVHESTKPPLLMTRSR